MPLSIGIPVFNAEKFLTGAIRSIFAQTYQDWELILVDDGSTDGSLEIAQSVKDPRVRVISDGENRKLSARLNQIVCEARYHYIGRMDADDLISPTRFEKQIAVLDAHPEIDLVTAGVFSVTNDLRPIGVRWHSSRTISPKEIIRKRGCGIVHAAILGRKAWFLRNPYDPQVKIAQDYDLWLRSCARNDFTILLLQEPLYYYREQSSATAVKMLAAYRNERRMYWKYGGRDAFGLVMRSWCKSMIVRMLSSVNQMDLLLRRRNSCISDAALLERFRHEIDQISHTRVPGLD